MGNNGQQSTQPDDDDDDKFQEKQQQQQQEQQQNDTKAAASATTPTTATKEQVDALLENCLFADDDAELLSITGNEKKLEVSPISLLISRLEKFLVAAVVATSNLLTNQAHVTES